MTEQTNISPELSALLEELDAMRAITKTRKYPGSESHIAVAEAIDRARCARLALEAIRKTDYDEARAVFTAAKTTTVSSRQAYDVAVDAYIESRDAGTKTAAASMRKAYLLAIIAQETAYRAVCNARSVMEQTSISPELAAVLETIVTALYFVGGVTPAVNVTAAALAARAALTKALQPQADDAGRSV